MLLPILGAVVLGLVLSQVAFLVTTVYLHRALSHRAVTLSPGVTGVCRVLTWILTGIRPRQWVAVHRKHHAHTDEEGDPHSPMPWLDGYPKVQFANAALYRKVAKHDDQVTRYARDLPPDRWDRVLFDHALVGLGIGVALLVLLFGWEVALVVAVVHASTYLLGGGAINGIGHRWGRRPYDNLATNNQWLAWLVAGEGLHNNHHAKATSSRMSLTKGEFDPGWWCIRALVGLHWAKLRVVRAPVPATAASEPAA
jgi:stearoyl-CoA desaturase (Delta-9 desaturase)